MRAYVTRSFWVALCLTPVVVALFHVAVAQVMTSSHYQIESDSVNVGGGYSSSSNYIQQSTVGEAATGLSSSTNYTMHAGYQQMQETYLALGGGGAVTLTPTIPGVTGGTASGTTEVHVTTDNLAGYQLTIAASQSPAMQDGGHVIQDYTPTGATPDYSFITGTTDHHLGFSPQGNDVVQRYLNNGSLCDTGSQSTAGTCWDGLSTSPTVIAQSTSANNPQGATTTIHFEVGIGSLVNQAPGTYVATTTITAFTL